MTVRSDVERLPGTRAMWAVVELVSVVAIVALDLLVPAAVVLVVAAMSLALRRRGPASLGFARLSSPRRTAGVVALLVALWSLAQVGIFMPVLERMTGESQDFGVFGDLEGNLGLLVLLLAASWTLGALVEEAAFRGVVVTRVTEVLGDGGRARLLAVVGAAVLFAAIHTEQGGVGVAVTFLDGLFFGWLRFHYRSVWAAVLAHGFSNTLGLLVFFTWGTMGGLW